MSLPSLATVSAMETRLGVPQGSVSGADLARAEANLADASVLVRAAAAGTTWVAEDGVTITAPAEVVTVVLLAALRVYRNPDGYAGESVDGYSFQAGRDQVGPYLTGEEVGIVREAAGLGPGTSKGVTGSVRVPSAYGSTASGSDVLSWSL